METLLDRCAGLDVHLESVTASVRLVCGRTEQIHTQTFGTTTAEILRLGDWLAEYGVADAVMESTGVYWKPVWNLLEDRFKLMLVNARHVRNVPGRKTDVGDSQWLAHLLSCGLLNPSFVPDPPQRRLRDLTRHRTCITQDRARIINRLQKVLEDANIKLACVASDIMGVSGRAMIRALADGVTDPAVLADMSKRQMRKKIPQLTEALRGRVTDHHRTQLKMLMNHIEFLDGQIDELTTLIADAMTGDEQAVELLDTIPGVNRHMAQMLLAEVGKDMSRFKSAAHLCSWATVCPGNYQSAGKRQKGTTRPGNRWLKGALTQAGWAASRTKNTYLSTLFWRLARRRGKKRAVVAAAHSILTSIYYILRDSVPYKDLGPDYLTKLEPLRQTRSLVKRLEKLGHKVVLQPAA